MKKWVLTLALAGALAGCSDHGADADGDGKISSKEVAAELGDGGAMVTQPGQWEITTNFSEIDVPGLPPAVKDKMKSQLAQTSTTKTCLTAEQVAKPGADFLGGDQRHCSFSKFNRSGSKLDAEMECKMDGGLVMTSTMAGAFEPQKYQMNIATRMTGSPMGAVSMKGAIVGKRLGDCPAT